MRRGEAWVIAGRNGAGKSTLLKALIGLLPLTTGTIRFEDQEIGGLPPYRIVRLGLGYVPEERRIFAGLTVRENLAAGRRLPRAGRAAWSEARVFGLFPRLAEVQRGRAGTLSGGEQQMLTIARTLMGNPELLLLDEPSEGLAPIVASQVAGAMRMLKEAGTTLLLAEQNLRFASRVADHVAVLERGRIVWRGRTAELASDTAASERYLALTGRHIPI